MNIKTALPLLVLGATALCGCDDPPKPVPATPSASAATASTTSSAAPSLPKPNPLAVDELKKSLECGAAGHGPCEILAGFSECTEWSPVTSSGDGRWLGEGHVVEKGAFVDEYTILRSKRVALSEVGPGQLPAKIGLSKIPDDRGTEHDHARKAINAFKRGDVPKKNINAAIEYLKERPDWPEAFAMQSDHNQVYVAAGAGMYLCQQKDQRLLVVSLAGNREHKADGVYATLYPVTW